MKVSVERRMPLLLLIILWVIGIGAIGALLVICFGEKSWFPALAYLVAASAIAGGGCIAYRQLRVIQGTERASVLTSLDTAWMGAVLETSRVKILELRSAFEDIKDDRQRKTCIKNRLRYLKQNDHKNYRKIVAMVCFFETIGYFSKVGYILPNDARELYGPAIRSYDEIFREHIIELQAEDSEIYANFIWLADTMKLK